MKHFSAAVALLLSLTVIAAGCEDQFGDAVGPDARAQQGGPGGGAPPQNAALEGQINHLINQLFAQPEKQQANKLFADMKEALDDGDTAAAQESAFELLKLALTTPVNDPPGQDGIEELGDLVFEFVGLDVPTINDSDDGVIAVALDGQDNTIVTEQEFAGTVIEDEDIDQDLVIVIERRTEQEQQQLPGRDDCLPTDLEQAEGCYQFDRFPEGEFADETVVGVCHETPIDDGFRLAKFESAADGGEGVVVLLPAVQAPFLDCTGFQVVSSDDSPAAWRLARRAWGATGGKLIDWLGPAPLHAIDAGVGGTSSNWSLMGWAKPLDITKTAGDGQQAPAGSTLPTDPTVQVTEAHGNNPQPESGVDVQFTVVQGGGSVSPSTVTTGPNGEASVSWTLGSSSGTNELEASVPRDTVIFTATAGGGLSFSSTFVAVDAESDDYYTLDPSTGGTTVIRDLVSFTNPVAMAMNSSDEVFIWNNDNPPAGSLVQLDVCSGQPTVKGSQIDAQDEGALAFAPGDTLYKFAEFDSQSHSKLYTLNPSTGAKVDSIFFTQSLNVRGLSATAGGDLMAAAQTVDNPVDLYRIDPSNGTLVQIGTFGQDIGVLGTLAFDDQGTLWGTGFQAAPPQNADNIVFQVDTASATVAGIQATDQPPAERAPQGMAFFSGTCP